MDKVTHRYLFFVYFDAFDVSVLITRREAA
jgi:hypothetical protein